MEKLIKYRALHTRTIISQYGKSETIKANGNKIPTLTIDDEGFAQWIVKGLIFSKKTNFVRGSKVFTDLYQDEDEGKTLTYLNVDNRMNSLMLFFSNEKKFVATSCIISVMENNGNDISYWYDLSLIN
jgi:hypothetical protein